MAREVERGTDEWRPVVEALLDLPEGPSPSWQRDPREKFADLTESGEYIRDVQGRPVTGRWTEGGMIEFRSSAGEVLGTAEVFDLARGEVIWGDHWNTLAVWTVRDLAAELNRRIASGELEARGRVGNPAADFSFMPANTWRLCQTLNRAISRADLFGLGP